MVNIDSFAIWQIIGHPFPDESPRIALGLRGLVGFRCCTLEGMSVREYREFVNRKHRITPTSPFGFSQG